MSTLLHDRFATVLGSRRGRTAPLHAAACAEVLQALPRLEPVLAHLSPGQRRPIKVVLARAITEIAGEASPRPAAKTISLSNLQEGRRLYQQQLSVEELLDVGELDGFHDALRLCVESSFAVNETETGSQRILSTLASRAVAFQVAWHVIADWEWLLALGVPKVEDNPAR